MKVSRKTKTRRTFENWKTVRELVEGGTLAVRVEYFRADLLLKKSNRVVPDVRTIAVSLWDLSRDHQGLRFVGVTQVGPGDEFLREHGRDVAAGRALKALNSYTGQGGESYASSDESEVVTVYGSVPDTVDLSETLLFTRGRV